jgi:hypothetical protein
MEIASPGSRENRVCQEGRKWFQVVKLSRIIDKHVRVSILFLLLVARRLSDSQHAEVSDSFRCFKEIPISTGHPFVRMISSR